MRPGMKVLRSIPTLARLPENVLDDVDASGEVLTFERGGQLFRQGTLPLVLYFLLDGLVALTSAVPDGSTAVVDVVRPMGDLVIASVIGALPYLGSAHAVTRARLVAIDAALVRKLAEREPALAGPLMQSMSHDIRGLVRHVRDLKLRTAAQRLGAFLLSQVDDPATRRAEFRLPFEKGLLAARLGCRQENLSRAFATLRDYGVETHGAQIILHSISKLTAYAVPDYLNDQEPAKPARGKAASRPAGSRKPNGRASA